MSLLERVSESFENVSLDRTKALAAAGVVAATIGLAPKAEATVLLDTITGSSWGLNANGNIGVVGNAIDALGIRSVANSFVGDGGILKSASFLVTGAIPDANYDWLQEVNLAFYVNGRGQFISSPQPWTATRFEHINSTGFSGQTTPIFTGFGRNVFEITLNNLEPLNIQTVAGQEHAISLYVTTPGGVNFNPGVPTVNGNFPGTPSTLRWNPGGGGSLPDTFQNLNFSGTHAGMKVETVPEPTSLAALSLGALALLKRRKED